MSNFASWADLLSFIASGRARDLWYKAPMSINAHRVRVVRVYKNGKVRIDPGHVHADPFTADAGHLDRFSHRA